MGTGIGVGKLERVLFHTPKLGVDQCFYKTGNQVFVFSSVSMFRKLIVALMRFATTVEEVKIEYRRC